jgi:hypothetical protein
MTMPDTKSGREQKGRNKRRQLESELASRDVETIGDDEAPVVEADDAADAEFLDPAGPDELEN